MKLIKKDNAEFLNNANPYTSESERTCNNYNADCEVQAVQVPSLDKIKPPDVDVVDTEKNLDRAIIINSVNVNMAPTTDGKNVVAVSDQVPAPESKEKKGKHRKEKPKDVVTFRTHLTSLAHVSLLVFVYMIIKMALRGEFVFFTWHPILMSVGWMLMMTEGFYAINKYNTYWRFKTKGGFRVKIHAILLGVGYLLAIVGFIVVYVNKNRDGKDHFVTWHALFGLIAIICTFPPVINGLVLWYKKELSRYVTHPRLLKFVHVLSGCMAFTFGALSLVLGVYSRWFAKKSEKSEYIFYTALLCVGYPLFWAVYGPAVKLTNVIKDYFSEEKEE